MKQMEKHIEKVKGSVMPFLKDVTQARKWAADMNRENMIENIAMEMDAALEQEELEDKEEGLSEHPELAHLNQDQYEIDEVEDEMSKRSAIYGKIEIPDEKEMKEKTRTLDENQRKVVDIVVKYCRSVVKARQPGNSLPEPDHMMVHGAAGTGKSTVILLCAQWAQKTLVTTGSDLDKPLILKTAFMGTAAANIGGQTLSSTFSMKFGNEYHGLGDRNRYLKRRAMENLQILIMDEISMVKADMVYQLDLILKEITQKQKKAYGGVQREKNSGSKVALLSGNF